MTEIQRLALHAMTQEVRENVIAHGFRDERNTFGDYIALLHSEVSEALEAFRDYHDCRMRFVLVPDSAPPQHRPKGVPAELADVFIRLLDMCDLYGIDLYDAYVAVMAFNKTRPYQHGGRTLRPAAVLTQDTPPERDPDYQPKPGRVEPGALPPQPLSAFPPPARIPHLDPDDWPMPGEPERATGAETGEVWHGALERLRGQLTTHPQPLTAGQAAVVGLAASAALALEREGEGEGDPGPAEVPAGVTRHFWQSTYQVLYDDAVHYGATPEEAEVTARRLMVGQWGPCPE